MKKGIIISVLINIYDFKIGMIKLNQPFLNFWHFCLKILAVVFSIYFVRFLMLLSIFIKDFFIYYH